MILLLETFTILGFGAIAFQDLRERMVSWILFPIVGILLASLHVLHTDWEYFLFFSLINILLISCVLGILYLYTKFLKNKKFLNTSFGLGDVLFLYAFALGYPPLTFIILFAFSICFALLGFLVLGFFTESESVPLAGLMGIFLAILILLGLLTDQFSLYLI